MMEQKDQNDGKVRRRALLVVSCVLLSIGTCGGPLIMRLYFLHGGNRVWLSSWLETGGWPIILVPITITYLHRRRRKSCPAAAAQDTNKTKFFHMKPRVFAASAVIGIITGLDDYLFAYGVARLPVSTSSLIIASQLAFTAVFAYLLVKHKFTSYSVNAVVLLTIAAAVLGLNTSGDRPANESNKEYYLGFLTTVAASALYGLVLPMVELVYKKAKQAVTYSLVMEIQMVMSFFATAFCTVGMLLNNDFKVIPREARNFGLGETKYYVVLAWSAIIWQCFFLGAIGVIFCSSSLFSGIVITVLLPVTEVLAVIFYREKFQAQKGVSLALSLWGFVSYFYGEMKLEKKMKKQIREAELVAQADPNP